MQKIRNYRLFGIINPFDVLIIVAIIAIIWAAHIFSAPTQAMAQTGTRIRYTIELFERPAGFYRQIEPGAHVYDSSQGAIIGVVVEAYALPFMQDVPDEAAGVFRRTPVAGREFTYIVVEAWADVTESGTYVNEFWIVINRQLYAISRDFAGRGHITHLEFLN